MSPQPARFDVIVIGAGPGGSSAALGCAKAGLRVAIVDRASFPRDKLCGGALSGRAQRELAQHFGPLDPGLFHPLGVVELALQGEVLGRQTLDRPILTTRRAEFDAALVAQAVAAGATAYFGRRIARLDPDGARVILADGTDLSARLLIGADGVHSQLARILGLPRQKDLAFALEVEAPEQPIPHVMCIDIGAAVWGYAWAFPKRGGTTLGIGGLVQRNGDLQGAFRNWLVQGAHPTDLRNKGHHLPFGGYLKTPGQGRCLLVGDAAGLVDPITGEGIALALHSGALAAKAAVRALGADAPATALPHYITALQRVHAELARARIWRRLVYAPILQRSVLRRLGASRQVQRGYLQLLQGDKDYRDLSLASLLRRLALLALGRG